MLSVLSIMQLIKGTFLKRYNRFLVDLQMGESVVTVHCPNSGSMKGLLTPGSNAWVSLASNPNRKLAHTLEMIESEGVCVGVNTHTPNAIVAHAIENKLIKPLAAYTEIQREVFYGKGTRIDLCLKAEGLPLAYVEVKNVTLKDKNVARFPDAITTRGTKHLNTLIEIKKSGARAIMIYLIQRNDCTSFGIAHEIDAVYNQTFKQAQDAGVEMMAYACDISPAQIQFNPNPLPLETAHAN